ncbi:MAG: type 1 glutamine amidotransferase [Terracidiphilus sp.]
MSKSLTVLQDVAWEGPGLITSEARDRGLRIDVRRVDVGASVPKSDDVEALVVMGGPMGAYETKKYPFLAKERALIAELTKRGRPVLGICLGAQLLARALGARVFPGCKPEVGFGSVQLTTQGGEDRLMGPSGPVIPVFYWHSDTFDLPEKAALLASSSAYLHQAFRIGNRAYGLQFHVEPDANTWKEWRAQLSSLPNDANERRTMAVEKVGRALISRFLGLAMAHQD